MAMWFGTAFASEATVVAGAQSVTDVIDPDQAFDQALSSGGTLVRIIGNVIVKPVTIDAHD